MDRGRDRNEAWRLPPLSKILFLAADPAGAPTLHLNEECRAIEEMLSKATFRDEIRFRSYWAVRLDDLIQALNDDTPRVVHFSGHGHGRQGIAFQAEDGGASMVGTEELVEIMQAAGDGVTAVVLNACYTELQARALCQYVPCVVGTSAAIADNAAIAYSRSLYRALASGRSVANAHKQGVAAFRRPRTDGQARDIVAARAAPLEDVARLLTRPDVDPERVYIAGPQARAIPSTDAATQHRRTARRARVPARTRA